MVPRLGSPLCQKAPGEASRSQKSIAAYLDSFDAVMGALFMILSEQEGSTKRCFQGYTTQTNKHDIGVTKEPNSNNAKQGLCLQNIHHLIRKKKNTHTHKKKQTKTKQSFLSIFFGGSNTTHAVSWSCAGRPLPPSPLSQTSA